MKNLTLSRLLTTAIGLKRYQLRNGKPPATLQALVPGFLPKVPIDLMDGKPLRYRPCSDGTWILYSVAANNHDDQEAFAQKVRSRETSAWEGKDWVWSRLMPTPGTPDS